MRERIQKQQQCKLNGYVMLCYVMLCYVMLCYAMLCYVMLCYAMLCLSAFSEIFQLQRDGKRYY